MLLLFIQLLRPLFFHEQACFAKEEEQLCKQVHKYGSDVTAAGLTVGQ